MQGETYSMTPSGFLLDVTNIERAGPSGVGASGAWIFSVIETTDTLRDGLLGYPVLRLLKREPPSPVAFRPDIRTVAL